MKANVGSSAGFTTVRSSPYRSAMRRPVGQRGAAQRVHPELEARRPHRFEVDGFGQRRHVGLDQVLDMRRRRGSRAIEAHPPHAGISPGEQRVGAVLDPGRDFGVGGATIGRIVLEPAVGRGIVRGRDDDAVREARAPARVPRENGVRDRRCRREAVVALYHDGDAVGRQHLERRALGGAGDGVRVLAQDQRPGDVVGLAVVGDGLADRQDVALGEGRVQGRAAVPAGAEAHPLQRIIRIRAAFVVEPLEPADVDQQLGRSGVSCQGMWGHHHLGPRGNPAKHGRTGRRRQR